MRMPSTQKGSTDPMWALVMEYAKVGAEQPARLARVTALCCHNSDNQG